MLLKKIDNFVNNFLSNFNFFAQFLLRLALGIAFIIHGYAKLPLPPQKLIDFFNFSPFLASLVCVSELGAGFLNIKALQIDSFDSKLILPE